jgi:hypothetical protein
MYDVGDIYPATVTVRDAAGSPVNASAMTFTFTAPDGTSSSPAPVNSAVGQYSYDLPITQYGLHRFRAVSTSPATAYSDVFSVADATWPAFVGLTEVKDHLNIPQATTTQDEELRAFILSASEVVESIVGSVSRRTVVETHTGRGQQAIMLRERPALSITSVTEDGVTLPATGSYSVSDAGVLSRTCGYRGSCWPRGVNNVVVTYVAGRTAVPWAVLDATRELIRINWRPQQGGNYSVFDQGRSDDFGQAAAAGEVRLGFFVPNTVMQRLSPSELGPRMA